MSGTALSSVSEIADVGVVDIHHTYCPWCMPVDSRYFGMCGKDITDEPEGDLSGSDDSQFCVVCFAEEEYVCPRCGEISYTV